MKKSMLIVGLLVCMFQQIHGFGVFAPQPDEDQLNLLNQGVDVFNDWRSTNTSVQILLSGADLSNRDLTGVNLQGAKLEQTNFTSSILDKANLNDSNCTRALFVSTQFKGDIIFSGSFPERVGGATNALFDRADFTQAYFENITLVFSQLINAKFMQTQFVNVEFSLVNFIGSTIQNSFFTGTKGPGGEGLSLGNGASFRDVRLDTVDFTGSSLIQTDLEGASLVNVTLKDTLFGSAILRSAQLINVQAQNIDFSSALCDFTDFTGGNFDGANFRSANLDRSIFANASFIGADFTFAFARRCNFQNANFTNVISFERAVFDQADMQSAKLNGITNMKRTQFKGADLKGANLIGSTLATANFRMADLCKAVLPDGSMYDPLLSREYEQRFGALFFG